jgi:hypothetical protein
MSGFRVGSYHPDVSHRLRRKDLGVLIAAIIVFACSGDGPSSPSPVHPNAADGGLATAANEEPAGSFRTNPPVGLDGVIGGAAPFRVTFNMCASADVDAGDELRYTYDFEGTGSFERGRCRGEHTYAEGTFRASVCTSDRQPDHEVCRTYTVVSHRPVQPSTPAEFVMTVVKGFCYPDPYYAPSHDFVATITPSIPPGRRYSLKVRVSAPVLPTLFFSQGSLDSSPIHDTSNIIVRGPAAGGLPLPHVHEHTLTTTGPHSRILVMSYVSYLSSTPPPITMATEILSFEVEGSTTGIAGPTSFNCP